MVSEIYVRVCVCHPEQDALVAIAVRLLQSTELYAFAIMPAAEDVADVVDRGDDDDDDDAQQDTGHGGGRLPSISIERLNDVVVLEEFARR